MLLAVHELALKARAIGPLLPPKTVLIVGVELPDVATAVRVNVNPLSAGLPIAPQAFIAVAIGMAGGKWGGCIGGALVHDCRWQTQWARSKPSGAE